MREAICPTCGAINQRDAETCWRCLAEVHASTEPRKAPAADSATG